MYKTILIALVLVFVGGSLAVAQPQPPGNPPQPPQPQPQGNPPRPPDPIGDNVFPPDLIMGCADQIGLTEEQKGSLMSLLEKAQPRFADLQPKLEPEVQALGALMKEEHPDTDKVLAQFDKVLAAEREIKRCHLALMIGLKNLLTPEQQARLREIRKKFIAEGKGGNPGGGGMPGGGAPQPIQLKMMSVQRQAQALKDEGRDVKGVWEIMSRFDPLMKERKLAEAEAVLDEALTLLGKIAGGQ